MNLLLLREMELMLYHLVQEVQVGEILQLNKSSLMIALPENPNHK